MLLVCAAGSPDHHQYKCFVGHRFTTRALLKVKEKQLEWYLWSAVAVLEHLDAACGMLVGEAMESRLRRAMQARRRQARSHHHKLKRIVEAIRVADLEEV